MLAIESLLVYVISIGVVTGISLFCLVVSYRQGKRIEATEKTLDILVSNTVRAEQSLPTPEDDDPELAAFYQSHPSPQSLPQLESIPDPDLEDYEKWKVEQTDQLSNQSSPQQHTVMVQNNGSQKTPCPKCGLPCKPSALHFHMKSKHPENGNVSLQSQSLQQKNPPPVPEQILSQLPPALKTAIKNGGVHYGSSCHCGTCHHPVVAMCLSLHCTCCP